MALAVEITQLGEKVNVLLQSQSNAVPVSLSLSSFQAGARHGLVLGHGMNDAVNQIINGAGIDRVPVIALVSGEMPWLCGEDLTHFLKLCDSPSISDVEALVQELGRTVQEVSHRSERTLLYCEDLPRLLRHERLANLIGRCLATGRKTGLSVLLHSDDAQVFQSCPREIAAQILPNLSVLLLREAGEILLDDVEDASTSNASLFAAMPSFEFLCEFIVQFDSAEAAEGAAWILRGRCTNKTQVVVPPHNSNSYALDTVSALVGSRWSLVKAGVSTNSI
ncbi:MAG: hypothetical protein MH252_01840 [Thermosynechococcaceae cyanobacterium MS004]|nr:hypothetical protein [Thermosynechococcaceae cyanobacterium MS004]